MCPKCGASGYCPRKGRAGRPSSNCAARKRLERAMRIVGPSGPETPDERPHMAKAGYFWTDQDDPRTIEDGERP